MKTSLKQFLAAAILVVAAPLASATVLNFDDLTGLAPLTNYGGLTFKDWTYYNYEQLPFNAASGTTRIFDTTNKNAFGSATAFTFQGASFAGASGVTLHFDMFLDGALVATSDSLTISSTPTFLASGFTGLLDSVTVTSSDPDFFVLDDLVFNAPASIPEPGSLALILGAIGVMGGMARRRKA